MKISPCFPLRRRLLLAGGSLLGGVLLLPATAHSTIFFFNQNGGTWSDPNNWTTDNGPMGVPMAADDAEFRGANATYSVTANGNAIHDLGIEAADLTLNLAGNLTVSGRIYGYLFGYPQTFGARAIHVTGGGTLSADSIQATTFTIGSGATVKTTNNFDTTFLNAAGATLNTGAFTGQTLQISAGSTLTSTSANVSSAFGPSTLDASTWNVSGQLINTNANTLTVKNGATLTSGSAMTARSGGFIVDGAGSSWTITNDATINSTSGLNGGLEVERGGTATVGGNLFIGSGGGVYANYSSVAGASRIDVSGKVDAGGFSSLYIGQNATLTSAGVATRDSAFLESSGTWTNTGGFVLGESGAGVTLLVTNGGTVTTTGDLIAGQGAAANTFIVGSNSLVTNVNGVLAQNAGSRTTASVVGTWTNSGTLTVADGGVATLAIGNNSGAGGTVTNTAATVGKQANSNGSVDIEGAGKWTVNGNLVVGAAGMSVGKVTAGFGGQLAVTGSTITLGRDAGSTGTLTLDDAFGHGSKFNFTGDLQVGLAGKGTLEVLSGFELDQGAKSLVLGGQATSNGTLRVSDDYAQYGSPAATQTTYQSTNLTVGSLGTGTVTIEHNGLVQTTGDATLGELAGGTGTATVTGTGSKWQVDGNLIIGKNGTLFPTTASHVTVSGGATLAVNGAFLTIGQETNSQGTLTLDGVGSKFTGSATTALEIGRFGAGTLELLNGAALNVASVTLGALAGGQGTVKVDGTASGGGPASAFVSLGSITVGGVATARGELDITNGGHVSSTGKAILGRDANSSGTVTLTWAGSDWNLVAGGSGAAGDLTIGQSGTGDLTVGSQATLTTGALVLGQNASGNGTLSVLLGLSGATASKVTVQGTLTVGDAGMGNLTVGDGAQLATTGEATLGKQAGSQGTVRLLGAGTTWTLGGKDLTVGQAGTGKLTVGGGAKLVDAAALVAVGLFQGGTGTLTVDGTGSRLQVKAIGLGADGDGLLSITNGGKVIADALVTGAGTGSGSVNVGGTGSTLEIKDISLGQARSFDNALAIFNGGQATISGLGANASVEFAAGGGDLFPDVSVSGTGSLLTVSAATLRVGNDAKNGSLEVSGGAKATAVALLIGSGSRVSVSGASTLTASGRLEVGPFGGNGNGTLELSENGQVTAPGVLVTGQVNVRGQGTTLTASGGASDLESGLLVGRGSVAVSNGGNVTVAGPLSVGVFGASSVTVDGAGTQLRAASATVGGGGVGSLATSDGGHVTIGSLLAVRRNGTLSTAGGGSVDIGPALFDQATSGQVRVGALGRLKVDGSVTGDVFNFGGTVGGSGTINGKVVNAGTVAPGDPQTLTINGDYEQQSGGLLFMTLGGTDPSDYDHLNVSGKLTLMSGSLLELDFLNGFAPRLGDRFDFLAFGTLDPVNAMFSQITIGGLAPGFLYSLAPDGPGSLSLTALNDGVAVPEPSAWLLLLLVWSAGACSRFVRVRS